MPADGIIALDGDDVAQLAQLHAQCFLAVALLVAQGAQPRHPEWPAQQTQQRHQHRGQVGRVGEVGKCRAAATMCTAHVGCERAVGVPMGDHAHLLHDVDDATVALHTVAVQAL